MGTWHDEFVRQGWFVTALDKQDSHTLYDNLFTRLIYPLDRHPWDEDRTRLNVQIEALVTVLITPGAWYDLSIPNGASG